MCRTCPVMAQCRAHALDVGEPYGIWGGLSETERELLLKRDISRTRGIRRSGIRRSA
jgi:WhiB family redox-sensing transcriptional regulator